MKKNKVEPSTILSVFLIFAIIVSMITLYLLTTTSKSDKYFGDYNKKITDNLNKQIEYQNEVMSAEEVEDINAVLADGGRYLSSEEIKVEIGQTMAFIVLLLIWTSKDFAPTIIGIVISFPIFYEATLNSLLNIDEGLLHMVRVYRVSRSDKLRFVIMPVIYIEIKKILTSTISLIFKVVISGEVYSQPQYGIGSNIQFEKKNK